MVGIEDGKTGLTGKHRCVIVVEGGISTQWSGLKKASDDEVKSKCVVLVTM